MNTYERICDIIRDNLCLEEEYSFSPELTFSELMIDSIDLVEIIMEIEDSFSVEITDEELEEIKSLGELTELITEKSS